MKTGIELITEERQEQIEKHGWDETHDFHHRSAELEKAALFAITNDDCYWQAGFEDFQEKVIKKSEVEQLVIAGALIAAEIDRLQNLKR